MLEIKKHKDKETKFHIYLLKMRLNVTFNTLRIQT